MTPCTPQWQQLTQQLRELHRQHPSAWPPIPQYLCFLLIFICTLLLGWHSYLRQEYDLLITGEQEHQHLKKTYQTKVKQTTQLPPLLYQKQQLEYHLAKLEQQFLHQKNIDTLLQDINQTGDKHQLQFKLFKLGTATPHNGYATLPIHIKLSGHYHDIGLFAAEIARLPHLLVLTELDLHSDGKDDSLTMQALLLSFVHLTDQDTSQHNDDKMMVPQT